MVTLISYQCTESGFSYFSVISIYLMLVRFVSAGGCHVDYNNP